MLERQYKLVKSCSAAFIFIGQFMARKVLESFFSKTIGSNVNMAPGDGFLNVIVLYLACFKIDFMNKVAD